MSSLVVYLPLGDVGLKLEAEAGSGHTQVGCRVRGWKQLSNLNLAGKVAPGSIVAAVDDVDVRGQPFHVVARQIRDSSRRKLTLVSASAPPQPKQQQPPADSDRENIKPLPNTYISRSSAPSDALSPAQLLRLLRKDSDSTTYLQQSNSTLSIALSPTTQHTHSPQRRDASTIKGLQLATRTVSEGCRSSVKLRKELADNESYVAELRGQLEEQKHRAKGSAGQMLLLQYRLEKARARPEDIEQITADGIPPTTSELRGEDIYAGLRHWKLLQKSLDELTRRQEEPEEVEEPEDVVASLQEQLLVQTEISARLESQLREWVEGCIQKIKRAAATDGVRRKAVTASPLQAAEETQTNTAEPIASNHRPDGYDERRLWLSAQKSLFGSTRRATEGGASHCLSPASFKEHMRRLRGQNRSVRDDIMQFRATLKQHSYRNYGQIREASA